MLIWLNEESSGHNQHSFLINQNFLTASSFLWITNTLDSGSWSMVLSLQQGRTEASDVKA